MLIKHSIHEEDHLLELTHSINVGLSDLVAEDYAAEPDDLSPELPNFEGRQACVVDPHAFVAAQQEAKNRGTDEVSRCVAQAFEEYGALADLKHFAQAPENFSVAFSRLQAQYPNFGAFLREIEGLCSRAALRPLRDISPIHILLVGPAGLGKTKITQAIANEIGTSSHCISMNGATAAFELRGLSRYWRGSAPGQIAKCFRDSRFANPMILLDEIDKNGREIGHARAIDTLLDLTEGITAKRFRDDCLQVEIDASHALFVATANDVRDLPDALLSRFNVIEVVPPSREQMAGIVQNMYRDMVAADRGIYADQLPEEVVAKLSDYVPREAKRRLNGAINAAAMRALAAQGGPSKPIALVPQDLDCGDLRPKRVFGFTPSND